jgi:Fe-S cluster biosynthesis and repair protein YggX
MNRVIFCCKLNQETEGMEKAPFPGPLGEKIFNEVSKQAWNMWLSHQTMLINEYRLSLSDIKSREFLKNELQSYFFGKGSEKPAGYTAKD